MKLVIRLIGAVAVVLMALGTAGLASADTTPPAPGTDACTALVSADATVTTAQGTVDAAQAAVDAAGANVTDTLTTALANAKLALGTAQKAAQDKLCTGTAASTTPTTTSAPASSTTTAKPTPADQLPPVTVGSLLAEINQLNCAHQGDQLAAIQSDQIRFVEGGATTQDAIDVSNALRTKQASLNCSGTTSIAPSTTTVTAVPNAEVPTVPNTSSGVSTGSW